ncbi:hypothetical protein [Staphylococcus pseudoxylosus]|uniref:hypothetical protein n=1 Tax=Staphylococcus pseudoxylosus TaxID=2282419 RepID=UPI003905A77F
MTNEQQIKDKDIQIAVQQVRINELEMDNIELRVGMEKMHRELQQYKEDNAKLQEGSQAE